MRPEHLLLPVIVLILLAGCADQKEETTTTKTQETTTTTKDIVIPDTTTIPSTTTTSTTTTSTESTTTSTTTSTTLEENSECIEVCQKKDYLSGVCRVNKFECRKREEYPYESRGLCPDMRYDTCCCRTNESVDMNSTFVFNVGTSRN